MVPISRPGKRRKMAGYRTDIPRWHWRKTGAATIAFYRKRPIEKNSGVLSATPSFLPVSEKNRAILKDRVIGLTRPGGLLAADKRNKSPAKLHQPLSTTRSAAGRSHPTLAVAGSLSGWPSIHS